MRRLSFLLLLTIAFSVAIASYVTWWNHSEKIPTPTQQPLLIQFQDNSQCDLAKQTCSAQFMDLQLEVVFPQQPIYLKPFSLNMIIRGKASELVTVARVHFIMQGMKMLTPVTTLHVMPSTKNGDQLWQGNAILPVCSSGRHDWRVVIELETATTQYRVQQSVTM